MTDDPRIAALPDIHGHAKGEHKPFAEERPIPYTARMLFLWFFHACRRRSPRFLMVADHINYLTFEDPAAVNLVRRALKLAQAGDLYGAAETAGVELHHAAAVSDGLRHGMRYSIGAEVDNDPRSRPDAQNIVDAMRPDGMVRSVHFLSITHPQYGENWMWPFDNPEFKELYDVVGVEQTWELYVATLLEAIDKLPGNIVGHFYVPAKFGHWPADEALEQYEDRFLDACAERGMAIEVNSRYFYKYFLDDEANRDKYRAVNLRLLRKAKKRGVMVAVGSDAHSPRDQGRAFDIVLELLDEAEINEIAFPINGRLARVALRATEEILRQAGTFVEPAPVTHAGATTASEREPATAVESTVAAATKRGDPEPVGAPADEASAERVNGRLNSPRPRRKRPSRAKAKPADVSAPAPATAALPVAAAESSSQTSAREPAVAPAPPRERSVAHKPVRTGPGRIVPSRAAIEPAAARAKKPATKSSGARTATASKAAGTSKAATPAKKRAKATAVPTRRSKKAATKSAPSKRSARPTAKKTATKKAAPRKVAAKRNAPARRSPTKKASVKKTALKKTAAKKTVAKRKTKSRR